MSAPLPLLSSPVGAAGPTDDSAIARVPTGVPDLDYLTGGVPAGSVVLLLGEPGAGHPEFALTSAARLMLHQSAPAAHPIYLGSAKGPFLLPQRVLYVSLTRSRAEVMGEIRAAFEPVYPDGLERRLLFRDLSVPYFADTLVPSGWTAVPRLLSGDEREGHRSSEGGPLAALAGALDDDGARAVVIVDSVTDLLTRRGLEAADLATLFKGLRRRAKSWGGLVYLLLTRGVAPSDAETALMESVDAVFAFRWTTAPNRTHRERVLLIEKSMPVLAHLSEERQGRFVIRIHPGGGLVTTQHERV